MATKFPAANPIRVQNTSKVIDYVNYMPQFDLMRLGQNYQRGIYANEKYIADFRINTELSMEVQSGVILTCTVILPNGTNVNVPEEQVTPAGWVGDKYWKYSYTPTTEGRHQMLFSYSGYINLNYASDFFYVSDPSELKDLVEINYYDTQNKIPGYWFDQTSQVWNPKAYYAGQISIEQGDNDDTIYKGDNGITEKTRAVFTEVWQLRLTDVESTYYKIVNNQLRCDNVLVNGVKCTVEDIAPDPKDKSNLIDITAKLSIAEENNGFLLT